MGTRNRALPAPYVKATAVLIHGYLAGILGDPWAGTKEYLRRNGYNVVTPTLNFGTKTIDPDPWKAATEVNEQLMANKFQIKPPIFLIGHSMGGLVSKAILLKYGQQWPIMGVITISSPHMGVRWTKLTKWIEGGIKLALLPEFIFGLSGSKLSEEVDAKIKRAIAEGMKKKNLLVLVEYLFEDLPPEKINILSRIADKFAPENPVIRELNRAFDYNIPFLLIGADARFREGDKIVNINSQVPKEYVSRSNVETFIVKDDHFNVKRNPQVLSKIVEFMDRVLSGNL